MRPYLVSYLALSLVVGVLSTAYKTILVSTSVSLLDVNYINEWINYHLHRIKFDQIIVLDGSADFVLEEYNDIYPTKVKVIHCTDLRSEDKLIKEEIKKLNNVKDWTLILNINEYLVLENYKSITELITERENKNDAFSFDCMLFGSKGHRSVDKSFTNPSAYSVIERFTSHSYKVAAIQRYMSANLYTTKRKLDSLTKFKTTKAEGCYVATFLLKSYKEFKDSLTEISDSMSGEDADFFVVTLKSQQYKEYLSETQLGAMFEILMSGGENNEEQSRRLFTQLDDNSVPDYSLWSPESRPLQWLDRIYNQPQQILTTLSFAVFYDSVEVNEVFYEMNISHQVDLFKKQGSDVVESDGVEVDIASSMDNDSFYASVFHHLITMFPNMRLSSEQLTQFMTTLITLLTDKEVSLTLIDIEGVCSAILKDFEAYYQLNQLTESESIIALQYNNKHTERKEQCAASYFNIATSSVDSSLTMVVIHHDSESLSNILNYFDHKVNQLTFNLVPHKIPTTVFFEYISYQSILDQLTAINSNEQQQPYVLITTHSTLTRYSALCGYEVSRLLSVAHTFDYDVVPLLRTKEMLLPSSIVKHNRQFKDAWDALLSALGYSNKQIRKFDLISPIYRNSLLIKYDVLIKLTALINRAIDVAQNNVTVRELLSKPMGSLYVSEGSESEEDSKGLAMRVFNTSYYQLFPFVFERLPAYLLYSLGVSVCYHNEYCHYNL